MFNDCSRLLRKWWPSFQINPRSTEGTTSMSSRGFLPMIRPSSTFFRSQERLNQITTLMGWILKKLALVQPWNGHCTILLLGMRQSHMRDRSIWTWLNISGTCCERRKKRFSLFDSWWFMSEAKKLFSRPRIWRRPWWSTSGKRRLSIGSSPHPRKS